MDTVPSSVEIVPSAEGTRIVLPVRQRVVARAAALVPMAFGLIFVGFALFWMTHAAGMFDMPPAPATTVQGPEGPGMELPPEGDVGGMGWMRWVFLAFGVPFLLVGLVPIFVGILMLCDSHSEILVTAEYLFHVNCMGPFRFRGRRSLAGIKTLRVSANIQQTQGKNAPKFGILAEGDVGNPLKLAVGYPEELLRPVAEFLAGEMKRRGATSLRLADGTGDVMVSVEDAPALGTPDSAAPQNETAPAQPTGSRIIFSPAPDSLTFVVPRTGFRGTALFFLIFALIWDGVSFTVFGVFLSEAIHGPSLENILPLLFILVFVLVGVVVALAAVQTAFRRAVIVATRDTLVYTSTGPLKSFEHQWKHGEITAVRLGDSGTVINGRPIQELQVYQGESKKGFFDGRDEGELAWIAGTLRAFYGVPARVEKADN